MPQPALSLDNYLANPLPELQGELPIGTGGKTPRPTWNEGSLKTLVKVDDFADRVATFNKSLPDQPIAAHPSKPYPQLTVAARSLNLSSEKDLLAAVKLPLDATLAVVSALDLNEHGGVPAAEENKGPIEADGQAEETVEGLNDRVGLSFGKSPLGETEFIFVDADKKPVLVVRAVTSTFQEQDWSEFSVGGKYNYNPKSRASWFWSRQWGGTRRLGVSHFILTDYNNWVFGCFDKDGVVADISPVVSSTTKGPTVLEALTYWVRSALGHPNAFEFVSEGKQAADGGQTLFPDNPARRASVKGKQERPRPEGRKIAKLAAESDVEDSDVAE